MAAAAAPGLLRTRVLPGTFVGSLGHPMRAPTNPAGAHAAVEEAEDRVKEAFEADTTLLALDLEVDDENGRLVLRGTVRTAARRRQAEAVAARGVLGIRIDNQIRVE